MPGDEAREVLRDLDLRHSFESEEGSVFSAGNWIVESTDPEAGSGLEARDEVTLNLVRPEDKEEEDEQPDEAEEDEGEPQEEDEDRFEIDHDGDDLGGAVPGGTTFVRFDIADNFSRGFIASGAQRDTCEALEIGLEDHPDTGRIAVEGSFSTMDEYGNEEHSTILRAHYDAATLDRIDFDNCQIIDVWDLRDGGQIDSGLLENR